MLSIIIPVSKSETEHKSLVEKLQKSDAQIIVSCEGSRARSLNKGAAKASGDFLWFLHADSKISDENLEKLSACVGENTIYYFDLCLGDGLPKINALGANIRSKFFALPYGDQGFFMSKNTFEKAGNYDEAAQYGEDVLFIRRAKSKGVRLENIPSKLRTSARAYRAHNWFNLTLKRMWQLIKLLQVKI